MTRLAALPPDGVVAGLKGVVDFAICRGVSYARRWPRPPSAPRSAPVMAQAANLGAVSHGIALWPLSFKQAAAQMSVGSNMTWRDVAISILLGGTYE